MQTELFPTNVHLTKVEPKQNMHRFYRMYLLPDLFGGCDLMRIYGRIGSSGRTITAYYQDEGHAQTALNHWKEKKQKRGYK
jgi:predicted DNA-binding WGR domain protein